MVMVNNHSSKRLFSPPVRAYGHIRQPVPLPRMNGTDYPKTEDLGP